MKEKEIDQHARRLFIQVLDVWKDLDEDDEDDSNHLVEAVMNYLYENIDTDDDRARVMAKAFAQTSDELSEVEARKRGFTVLYDK